MAGRGGPLRMSDGAQLVLRSVQVPGHMHTAHSLSTAACVTDHRWECSSVSMSSVSTYEPPVPKQTTLRTFQSAIPSQMCANKHIHGCAHRFGAHPSGSTPLRSIHRNIPLPLFTLPRIFRRPVVSTSRSRCPSLLGAMVANERT